MNGDENRQMHSAPPGSASKMGEMPVLRLIFTMSLPAMFSMFVQACYNIVDSIFVSRLGDYALAAVSLVFPVQLIITAVSVGLGVGLASLISRRLGEQKKAEASSAAQHGLMLCFLHWLPFLFFGIFGAGWFCGLYADSYELYSSALSYCSIICAGSFFSVTESSFEKIMQAGGNMTAPMICLVAGACANIVLDPIMIFGLLGCPARGVAGAAYATVISQALTFILANVFMYRGNLTVRIRYRSFKVKKQIIRDIYQVGFPAMIMQSINSVTILVINAILVSFGAAALAALGVYAKLETFIFLPLTGMNQGLLPVMGYNYGAGNRRRLMKSLKYGCLLAAVIMIAGMMIFKIFPGQLMSLFDAEGDLLELGIQCLTVFSWCFPVCAVRYIIDTLFQATAHGTYSLLVSFCRQVVGVIPFAFLLSLLIGVKGVWWSYLIGEGIALIISLVLLKRIYKNDIMKMKA